ncbi:MAG TPA: HEPN domain-containing protein, partial [Spirochaetota bacterium]|nr:HEPN domain-containing protein [Spirochaetota bacterium]
RSYYCVFHIITACLLSKGLTFSSHKQVIGNFNKEFIKTNIFPSDLSKKIKILFDDRQVSDYDVKTYIDEEKSKEDLLYAEEIFNIVKEYLSNF